MCNARSEGGQRCTGHTHEALLTAEAKCAAASRAAGTHPTKKQSKDLRRAQLKQAEARAKYASTPEGQTELRERLTHLSAWRDGDMQEMTDLHEALNEGQRLRRNSDHIRTEVRAGRMTKEAAVAAATYPTPQARALRASTIHLASTRTMALPQATGLDPLADLGAAEQAVRAKKAELPVLAGSPIVRGEIAIAENNLFDARVHYAATPEGESALRAELAAHPNPPSGRSDADYRAARQIDRERRDLSQAIDEGVRYRALKRDLAEQVNLGLISYEQAQQRSTYPTEAVRYHRERAMMAMFDHDALRTHATARNRKGDPSTPGGRPSCCSKRQGREPNSVLALGVSAVSDRSGCLS